MKILATILLLLLCFSPNLWAGGFGNDNEGDYNVTIEEVVFADLATPASSGILDSIKVWITVTGSSHEVKLAVYQYSDTSFIDSTEIIDVSSGPARWVYFDFINNASITASTEYALAVVAEAASGDCKIDLDLAGSSYIAQQSFPWAIWPIPKWTTADSDGNYEFSIYCYYTAEEAAVGQVITIQQ